MESERQGSSLGATLMVAGSCIGAGMLGLPVLSSQAGFYPTLIMFIISWLFMFTTSLLLLEVNLWFEREVSIISMVRLTLGNSGKIIAAFLYLFLFYSILVAYMGASGAIVHDFFEEFISIPVWLGSLAFLLLFGALIFLGTKAVDLFNRLLMIGLFVSYIGLVFFGLKHVNVSYFEHQNWGKVALVIPVMVISFGYHNLVPSLKTYLQGQRKSLFWAFFFGSAIPLIIYLLWVGLILGLVPAKEFEVALEQGTMATSALKKVAHSSWVTLFAEHFAFYAIISSFLTVALAFVDFLADGLSIPKSPKGKLFLLLLTLLPPFGFSLLYPDIFLKALSWAGAFGAVILFGIMPAMMVWRGRYSQSLPMRDIVKGGKATLLLVILFGVLVILLELIQELNLKVFQ